MKVFEEHFDIYILAQSINKVRQNFVIPLWSSLSVDLSRPWCLRSEEVIKAVSPDTEVNYFTSFSKQVRNRGSALP
ncbi:hypothetical protein [Sulfuracidifex tepidarius]|nr:hypothetical protein [Sulfuracidifex tepidarius]